MTKVIASVVMKLVTRSMETKRVLLRCVVNLETQMTMGLRREGVLKLHLMSNATVPIMILDVRVCRRTGVKKPFVWMKSAKPTVLA